MRTPSCLGLLLLLAACAGTPQPDWQLESKSALDRATAAWLSGNSRVAAVDAARARAELARTGRPELLARAELLLCAARVAGLEFDDCPAFAPLAADSTPAERAYADYLAGRPLAPAQAGLLPPAQRAFASAAPDAAQLAAIEDPLARLVAAGAALRRSGRMEAGVVTQAIDTASAQGWRRPLLAWLHLGVRQAEAAGEQAEAVRLRRRIAVVLGT